MIKQLRRKFVIITMSIVMLMITIILSLIFFFTKQSIQAQSISMMQSIANRPFQVELPKEASERIRLPYFSVRLDRDGQLSEVGGDYYDLSDKVFLEDLIRDTLQESEPTGIIEEYHFRFCRIVTPFDQTIVYSDISSEQATLSHLLKICVLIGLLSIFAFFLISVKLAKWAIQPIEEAWNSQKQFIADASHELKTPLTVIMTNAELLLSPETNSVHFTACSSNILTMSKQMRKLIEQMLLLARTEQLDTGFTWQSVNLSQLVSDSILPFEPLYFESCYQLEIAIEENIFIKGDPERLKQTMEILFDNASKYTKEQGRILVSLKNCSRNRALISVSNEGEPIPREELPLLFRRFYRVDKARKRDGSYGLGLSIAESIVQQHKGRIWAESGGGWNTFSIELNY